jgi:anaerobic C4-dicarboxylate transporter
MSRETAETVDGKTLKKVLVFSAAALALVAMALGVSWPLMNREGWRWLALAGAVAFVAQVGLHVALLRWREDPKKFMKAVVFGAGGRLAVIVAGLTWVAVSAPTHPVVFMLGLVGFLFGMLLIESGLENTNRFRPEFAAGEPAVRG